MNQQPNNLTILASAIALTLSTTGLIAEDLDDDNSDINETTIVILGDDSNAQNLAGSGNLVSKKQLDNEMITDINQALKTVPGIYIREEDGFGLRPNIGIRAATGSRSARITLMEDGVLIAPAPYAAPAAYYFPNTMRMSFLEVIKGAPLLRHGPFTTGGILNLVSTPIPNSAEGNLIASIGSHGSSNIHGNYGGSVENWGWSVEGMQRQSQGFKTIDRSNRDTGFDISDFVTKIRWESASGPRQDVQLKLQRSFETSNETYLGLSDADYQADPNRRYGLSELDQMDNDHTGIQLSYHIELDDNLLLSAQLYRNDFSRDWFKLNGGGSLIASANNGDPLAIGILNGTEDTTGLEYKHNAREYLSQGVELNFDWQLEAHALSLGLRSHEDEEDRFQPTERYDQINGSLVYQTTSQPSSSNNRTGSAEALSLWFVDQWQVNEDLNLNIALRYEDIDTAEVRYGDLDRLTISRTTENTTKEWMSGLSGTYELTDSVQLVAGVHRGFSPLGAGASENENPETSDNWELGFRFKGEKQFVEILGFYSDFSNKEEQCSVGNPCSNGATSGRYVTGAADISGLEFQYHAELESQDTQFPIDIAYTYTQAEISADNAITGVQAGDQLRDIPTNSLSVRLGIEPDSQWSHYAVYKYIDESCAVIGCNRTASASDQTESLSVFDWVSRYSLTNDTEVFLKVENVFDEQAIISRVPDGPRPNLSRTFWLGMQHRL